MAKKGASSDVRQGTVLPAVQYARAENSNCVLESRGADSQVAAAAAAGGYVKYHLTPGVSNSGILIMQEGD